eukprot:195002-Chlamydomonas_euryale.AAC.1
MSTSTTRSGCHCDSVKLLLPSLTEYCFAWTRASPADDAHASAGVRSPRLYGWRTQCCFVWTRARA